MLKQFNMQLAEYIKVINEPIDFINNVTFEIFGVKSTETLDETEFVDKDTFYFKFGSSSPAFLAPDIKDFLFLLPQKIRDKIMLSDLMKRVEEELEKNSNNLRWDYSCKLRDSKFVFESIYQEHIDKIIKNIEDVLVKTLGLRNKEKNKVEEQLNSLQKLKTKLYLIKGKMPGLY